MQSELKQLLQQTRRPKRAYRMTPEHLAALRDRFQRIKPWLKSTGPRTEMGERISSQNGLTHGLYTPEFADVRRQMKSAMRQITRCRAAAQGQSKSRRRLSPAWMVVELAERIG